MSTRFENSLIMPRGPLGNATLLRLPQDDRASVLRWHRREWEQFIAEVMAYQGKIYAALEGRYGSKRKQRGSILIASAGAAAASGVGGDETVTLSGTSGSPNTSTDTEDTPTNALAGWRFYATGRIMRIVSDTYTNFNLNTEWIDSYPSPVGDYWLEATNFSGDNPNLGSALNTWHVLAGAGEATFRNFEWLENSDPLNEATTAGTLQVEISDESDGTPVLDTGFYRGTATQFGTA